ncbi:MAG: type II toxin-antitoxin system VapC family toxin [Chloroflexaceae bacterium]
MLHHSDTDYEIVAVSRAIISRAVALTQDYRLRGYDAVQLATALVANAQYVAASLPALTFVAADTDLITVAQAEGLVSENPNLHP